MAAADYYTQVYTMFVAYFGRPPAKSGLENYANLVDKAGGNVAVVIDDFFKSDESKAFFAGKSVEQQVNQIFQNVFGRDALPEGLNYWTNLINNGTVALAQAAYTIAMNAAAADLAVRDAKIASAKLWVAGLDTTPEILAYGTDAGRTAGRDFLKTVTASTPATQAATDAALKTMADGGSTPGQTFTLTTGADIITGTSGNDTIVGSGTVESTNGTFTTTSFNTADQINGGAGTDTLSLTIDGALKANTVTAINDASISNVETLNLRNVAGTTGGTQAVSADASLIPGLTAFNSDRSTNTVTVTNLASGASAGVIGDGTVTNGQFNAGYAAAATAATLNISGGTKGGMVVLSGTGLTSTTVNSTGAANTIGALELAATTTDLTIDAATKLTTGAVTNTTAAALTTLTVKGAGAVDLSTTALETTVTKIDASANTGGLTVKLSDKATIAVTGSAGNDVITTNAILTTGTVNAGAGTDTLNLGTNTTHADTAALAAKYTNFETLRVNGTYDASLIAGITAIELSGATNTITKMTAAQAAAVTARADIGATSLALATDTGTADVLSLTMGTGTTTAAATNATTLTINGFETLNVKTNAGPTATVGANKTTTIAAFTADKLTAINLTGNAVTLGNAATTKAVTIDASQLTGDGAATPVGLTISGNLVAGSTVTGSGVKDVFNLGTVGSTYNAGAGNDTFAATAVTQLRSGATYNTLNGGDGTDTLTITSAGAAAISMVDDDFKAITNIEKITLDGVANTGASDITVTTGGWYDASFKAAGSDLTIKAEDNDAVSFTGGTFSGVQKLTVETAGVGNTTADNVTVLTGSGNDTVTVTASSWVGHATTNGAISIATGAGNDTISLTTGTLLANANAGKLIEITGGTGADTITVSHTNDAALTGNIIFNVAAGDSAKAAFDNITGFKMSDIGGAGGKSSDGLNFGTAAISAAVAATAVSGFAASELTYAINGTTGEVTFDGTKKADLTVTQVLDILDTVVANGKTVFWTTAATGGDTYVYNADAAGDSVVKLVGVNADALITTNDATTDNGVFIL